ncbi:MAG: hypothetical protein LUH02_12395 [Erysipelotrichaceae bacterium]|nr:hypothetical protein [Erysipelotrichaceae bacterium]
MDDLSCYDFAYYHYKLGNYQEAYSYAKTCYEMRKKQNNDQEIEDIINILLDSLDKLDDGSLSYLKERYEQY